MQAAEEVARDLERQIADVTSKVRPTAFFTARGALEPRADPSRPSPHLQIDEYISAQSAALTSGQQEHEAAMRELETRIVRLKADHSALGLRVATTHGRASTPACARISSYRITAISPCLIILPSP